MLNPLTRLPPFLIYLGVVGAVLYLVVFGPRSVFAPRYPQTQDTRASISPTLAGPNGVEAPLEVVVQNGAQYSVATYDPQGRVLATAGFSNKLALWRATDGALLRELGVVNGHRAYVSAIVFSPDGKTLASGGDDSAVKLWRVIDGALLWSFDGQVGHVNSLAFSHDGTMLAVGGQMSGRIQLWQVRSRKLLRTLDSDNSPYVETIAFSLKNDFLASLDLYGAARLWRISDGALLSAFRKPPLWWYHKSHLGVDRSGDIFFAAAAQNGLEVLDLRRQALLYRVAYSSPVTAVTSNPQNNLLVTGHHDGSICLWDLRNGRALGRLRGIGRIEGLSLSPDGKLLSSKEFTLGSEGAYDRLLGSVWDVLRRKRVWSVTGRHILAFSPDSKTLVSHSRVEDTCGVCLWKVREKVERIRALDEREWLQAMAVSGNARRLVVLRDKGYIEVWDIVRGEPIGVPIHSGGGTTLVALDGEGREIATGADDGVIRLWNADTGKMAATLRLGAQRVMSLLYSPGGNLLAAGGEGGRVRVWTIPGARLHATLEGNLWVATSLAFSPDERLLAVATNKGDSVNLWDLVSGQMVAKLRHSKDDYADVTSVDFAPTGKTLASGDINGVVKIWSIPEGREIRTFRAHRHDVQVAFTSDGKWLVSAGDGDGRLWRTSDWRLNGELPLTLPISSFVIGVRCDKLFYNDGEGIVIASFPAGALLARLLPYGPTSYVLLTPEGYFASPTADGHLTHFVRGFDVFEFNQFFDAFFRPDLVRQKLDGKPILGSSGRRTIVEALRSPPPHVELTMPLVRDGDRKVGLKVRVVDRGGGLGNLRIYHNGKLIVSEGSLESTGGALTGGSLSSSGVLQREYQVGLVPGRNLISAAAFNHDRTVMSAVKTVEVVAYPEENAPRLFVLCVGIDKFDESNDINLRTAVKDAQDLGALLERATASTYQGVSTVVLKNATKLEILEAVREMSARMLPTDVFLFFVASHGKVIGDRYYILASNYDGVVTQENTISSYDLIELGTIAPALTQIFVLDTCYAGSLADIVTKIYDSRIRAIAASVGVNILAGAKTFQEAKDDYAGNGLFSHFLLKGLAGDADLNKDRQVDIEEVKIYLASNVPRASAGMQEPVLLTSRNRTPIARVIR